MTDETAPESKPVAPRNGAEALVRIQQTELTFVNTLSDVEIQLELISRELLVLKERLVNISIALREVPELTELRIKDISHRLESRTHVT